MTEHEEFLEEKDFKRSKIILYGDTLAKTNGHPKGDGEVLSRTTEGNVIPIFDDEVIAVMPNGQKIYRSEDPGEMYKPKEIIKHNDLLEATPEHLRRTLVKGTLIQRTDGYSRLRRGFTEKEDSIARRVVDENGRPVINNNLTEYTALTEIKFGFRPKNNDKWISFIVRPGENFWSPRNGEKKKESK